MVLREQLTTPTPRIDTAVLEPAPRSWYFVGSLDDLAAGPRRLTVADRELVAYRTRSGRSVVLDGRCAHMGACLANGKVAGESLRCPFHGWVYGTNGRALVPGLAAPPDHARVHAYPTAERHGLLYVFLGERPDFELPFYEGLDPDAFVAARPVTIEAPCPWFLIGANGFDEHHFAHVHGRAHRAPPRVDQPDPDARRVVHPFRITGRTVADRLSRRLFGGDAELTFVSWRGNLILGTMDFGRFVNRIAVHVTPTARDRCRTDLVIYLPRRGAAALVRPAMERVLRLFTRLFFAHEAETLGQLRFDPDRLAETDDLLRGYLGWLTERLRATALA